MSIHDAVHGSSRKKKKKGISGAVSGFAKPGSTVTRKVSRGPGAGDTVQFKANSASANEPGKLKPRRVIKDVKPKKTQKTLEFGKKRKKS